MSKKKKKSESNTNQEEQALENDVKIVNQPKVRLGTFADIWPKDLKR